ncbi:MAG: MbnP family protein [Bacteroidota bacterium]
MTARKLLPITFLFFLFIIACKDDKEQSFSKMSFVFSHEVNGVPLVFDTLKYVNDAGNHYMVNDIQYFISNMTLYKDGGKSYKIKDADYTHYVDTYLPNTFSWIVPDQIEIGTYDSLNFILGLDQQLNKTGYFVNPPQVDMFWPDVMGGGFHYLKMNGKWLQPSGQEYPFNFHMGIGMEIVGNDTTFIPNFVKVSLPASVFSVKEGVTTKIAIKMNIESWFRTPHLWNWDSIGGAIMMNQSAMNWAKENGADVFSMSVLP